MKKKTKVIIFCLIFIALIMALSLASIFIYDIYRINQIEVIQKIVLGSIIFDF